MRHHAARGSSEVIRQGRVSRKRCHRTPTADCRLPAPGTRRRRAGPRGFGDLTAGAEGLASEGATKLERIWTQLVAGLQKQALARLAPVFEVLRARKAQSLANAEAIVKDGRIGAANAAAPAATERARRRRWGRCDDRQRQQRCQTRGAEVATFTPIQPPPRQDVGSWFRTTNGSWWC